MIWISIDKKPRDGLIIAILNVHWKNNGYLSSTIDFGIVQHSRDDDSWNVYNNDDIGHGYMTWKPDVDFEFWAFIEDFPSFPKRVNK